MATTVRRMSSRKMRSAKDADISADSSKTRICSGHLRPLYKTTSTTSAVFIVVPGLGKAALEQWHSPRSTSNRWRWLYSPEIRAAGDVTVFIYDHDLPIDSMPSLDMVNYHGARLLDELQSLQSNYTYEDCPMVFVSHSIGGFILKRAICLAYNRPEHIRGCIAAAVLISSPHSKEELSPAWTHTLPRMHKPSKRFGRATPTDPEMGASLSNDCVLFERAFQHFPVATVYEMVGTRTGLLARGAKVLVDQELARTNVPGEELLGIDLEHHSTCRIETQNKVMASVTSFLLRSLATAHALLREADNCNEGVAFITDTSSVAGLSPEQSLSKASTVSRPYTPPMQSHGGHSSDVEGGESGDRAPPSTRSSTIMALGSDDVGQGHTNSAGGSRLPSLIPAFTTGRADAPNFPYFVVPFNPKDTFFGRESTLAQMQRVLCCERIDSQEKNVISFAVTGQAGIGKTQVAVQFVHRHQAFFDAIFWVQAYDIERLHESFREIAIKLGLVKPLSPDSFDRSLTRRLVIDWLERPPKRSRDRGDLDPVWLIVFDSVNDPNLLRQFLPLNTSGRVLITSKDPLAISPFYVNKEAVKLAEFDPAETSELLLRLTGRENDENDKRSSLKFAARLGGIPLAIVTMAGVITRKNITFAEFLQEYKEGHSHATLFDTMLSPHYAHGYERTIASAYGLDNLEYGRDLLDVLSFFDPDGISEDIILDNDAHTVMDMTSLSRSSYQEARTELLQSSLITRNRNDKSLTVHRLTQDNARAKMRPDRYEQVFTTTLQLLAEVWPYGEEFGFLSYKKSGWSKANELYIHILHVRKRSDRVLPPRVFTPEHLQPLKVLLEAAWFGIMRGDFKDAKALLDLAAKMLNPLDNDIDGQRDQPRRVIDGFKDQRRRYHFYRGSRALHTNEPKESLLQFEKFWIMLRDEVIEPPRGRFRYLGLPWNETYQSMLRDSPEDVPQKDIQYVGMAWNELGNAYLQNDDTTKAEACYRKSSSIMNVANAKVTPNTISMPLINLGFALWLKGDLPEAAVTFEQALKYREKKYGSGDIISFATGKLYLGYGNVKKDQNDLDASFELHRKCLLQYISCLGKTHHRIGDGSVRVSDHYVRTGNFTEAKELLDRACDIYGGQSHFRPEQARATYKRASVLRQMQRYEEADIDVQAAYKLFREVSPDDTRGPEQLTVEDYDRPIMFWSK